MISQAAWDEAVSALPEDAQSGISLNNRVMYVKRHMSERHVAQRVIIKAVCTTGFLVTLEADDDEKIAMVQTFWVETLFSSDHRWGYSVDYAGDLEAFETGFDD